MTISVFKKVFFAMTLLSFLNAPGQEGNIKITNTRYKHTHAKFSPVEDLILFVSNMEGKKSIYIINSKGENIKRLTSLEYEDSFPSWSPDGKQIAFSSLRDNRYQIFIYDLITHTQRPLTSSEYSDYGLTWSPDGKMIAYSSKLRGRGVLELFIIDVDGENKKQLTSNKRSNIIPVFSSDGERIFFQSNAFSNDNRKPDILAFHLPTSKIEIISDPKTGLGIDPFIYAPNKELAFFRKSENMKGFGTCWIDLETKKMTFFDIKAKTPGFPTWSYHGKYVTVADRKLREIHIYDIENSKIINVTATLKISEN